MAQGSNRLQRGLLYVQHLNAVFVAAPAVSAAVVPGMGHNNSALFASAPFVAAVYAA